MCLLRIETVKNEEELKTENRRQIENGGQSGQIQIDSEGFVFLEKNFNEKQNTLELQYYTEYNKSGIRKIAFTDAAN